MSDLIKLEQIPPPEIPDDWDFEEADKEFDKLIFAWRRLTDDVIEKLWFFYGELPRIEGRPKKTNADALVLPTWKYWLKSKGIGYDTPIRHFRKKGWLPEPERIESPSLPAGKYFVLYADPPWQYDNCGFNESAAQQYPTMPTEKICELPVYQLIDKKAVLFLWVTNSFLEDGLTVCKSWGFDYKTNFVWIKNKGPSVGWFCQSRHELLFIATKGEGVHPTEKMISWFEGEVTRHSQKPDKVYEMIEAMYSGPYVELFARNKREEWDNWGNEILNDSSN